MEFPQLPPMNNYRVVIPLDKSCNYWGKKNLQAESSYTFPEVYKRYYYAVKSLRTIAKSLGIQKIWCFFEPDIEITWISTDEQAKVLIDLLESVYKFSDSKLKMTITTPKDGQFAEWFGNNPEELEFGAHRYAICADLVDLFDSYKHSIKDGKGVKKQVERTIHAICNPLGLNYMDEAKICFSRGLICLLFRFFSFKKAVWIYKNIFRQKY